jgi:hypothetical protein
MKEQLNTVKKTPTDFMIEEFDELFKLYQRTQFPIIDYYSDPESHIKQKKRMTFDILCDRLGPENSKEYEELIDAVIKREKRTKDVHAVAQKVIDIGVDVIKDLERVDPQVLIERALHEACQRKGITTADKFADAVGMPRIDKMDFYIYVRKYALRYLQLKDAEYIDYVNKNISFWRSSNGKSLPKKKSRYLWSEAIWLCKSKTGSCYTDELWQTIKTKYYGQL